MSKVKVSYSEQACFVCGVNNPDGFKVKFVLDGEDSIRFTTRIPTKYQGYDGIVHGGLISTMLDEVMANCFFRRGIDCLTTEMNVRFLKALPVETEIVARARMKERNSRIGIAEGWIEDSDGNIYAEGFGKFYLLKRDSNEVLYPKSEYEGGEC